MAVATKAAAFAIILRLFDKALIDSHANWAPAMAALAAITIVVGNVGAIAQRSLKRLLAWSAVAQAGYMLAGVVVGTQLGLQATAFYLAVYLFMNVAAFAVVVARERVAGDLGDDISAFEGLGRASPWLAWPMTIAMLALAGFPATAGFIGKFYLIRAAVDGELHVAGDHDRDRLDDLARLLPARDRGDVDDADRHRDTDGPAALGEGRERMVAARRREGPAGGARSWRCSLRPRRSSSASCPSRCSTSRTTSAPRSPACCNAMNLFVVASRADARPARRTAVRGRAAAVLPGPVGRELVGSGAARRPGSRTADGYVHEEAARIAMYSGRPYVWTGDTSADGRKPLDPRFWFDAPLDDVDGRFTAVRVVEGQLVVMVDALGAYPLYTTEVEGTQLFSNSAEVLRVARGGSRAPSVPVLASLLGGGWSLDGHPLWEGIERVSAGMTAGSAAGLPGAGFDADRAAAVLTASVRALADWPGRPSVVPVTGGRDSRLVLGAALAAGIDFETTTGGEEGHPDVEIGRQLAEAAGVPHRDPRARPARQRHERLAPRRRAARAHDRGHVVALRRRRLPLRPPPRPARPVAQRPGRRDRADLLRHSAPTSPSTSSTAPSWAAIPCARRSSARRDSGSCASRSRTS